jgi:hypothetical protein
MTNIFLFASLGFFEGMGRAIDLGSTMVTANQSLTVQEADFRAISSDWKAVGEDIKTALEIYGQKAEKE